MERTIRKAKKEIADAKAKLSANRDFDLCWGARRLLQLYAQGYHDWCAPEYRKPWRETYQEALKNYGEELSHPETISSKTLYWLGFMAYYRGQPDEEKQWESELEFWLLARALAPQATEELLLHKGTEHLYTPEDLKARREFLADLDRALTDSPEESEASGGTAPTQELSTSS
jgi:hypothetical protein